MKAEVMTMDAIEYASLFKDDFFDLIILDPDYQDWKTLIERGLLSECLRVLKKDGNILCFTKQPFDYALRIACNKNFRREIVWTFDNGGAWCSPKMPLISSQKVYWLTKSKEFYFNARTGLPYAYTTKNFKRKTKVFGEYESEGKVMDEKLAVELAYKNGYEQGVKDFAERLKEHKCHYSETEYTFDFDGVTVEDIDNLVKEMTEQSVNKN